jgi:hypothetical protein
MKPEIAGEQAEKLMEFARSLGWNISHFWLKDIREYKGTEFRLILTAHDDPPSDEKAEP